MGSKARPEVIVNVYGANAIPRRSPRVYSFADIFHQLIKRDHSDSPGSAEEAIAKKEGVGGSGSWGGTQPLFEDIDGPLEFITMSGTISEGSHAVTEKGYDKTLSGFVFSPRRELYNCVAPYHPPQPSDKRPPKIPDPWRLIDWTVVQGKADDWETYMGEGAPYVTKVGLARQNPNRACKIQSVQSFEDNQQFEFDITFQGVAAGHKTPGGVRISLGGNALSIVFRQDLPPTIEVGDLRGNWKLWKKLEGCPMVTFNSRWKVQFRRYNNRLCIYIQSDQGELKKFDIISTFHDKEKDVYHPINMYWPSGKIQAQSWGVSFLLGVSTLVYREKDIFTKTVSGTKVSKSWTLGESYKGTLYRIVKRPGFIPEMSVTGKWVSGCWIDKNSFKITPKPLKDKFEYLIEMFASRSGIDSPMMVRCGGTFQNTLTTFPQPPINIALACTTATCSGAEPPILPGAQWELNYNREILELLGIEQGVNIKDYVRQDNPVEIIIRWLDESGLPIDGPEGQWTGIFAGYIAELGDNNPSVNVKTGNMTLRDPSFRLMRPASIIDYDYMPLDFLAAEKIPMGIPLYGYDCIKYMLDNALGKGYGDELQIFLNPSISWPLISADEQQCGFFPVIQPMVQNAFTFPPPFGEDVWSWMSQIAEKDRAILFYAYPLNPTGNSTVVRFPKPHYGHYLEYTKRVAEVIVRIPDAVYIPGDENRVMFNAQTNTLGNTSYNRVLIWSNLGADPGLIPWPALMGAESKVSPNHFNAGIYSWDKTLVQNFSDNWPVLQGILDQMANDMISQWAGNSFKRVALTFRGNAFISWGNVIQPIMTGTGPDFSDIGMDISGKFYRVIRYNHSIDFQAAGEKAFTTEVTCTPLSPVELEYL
jgi:hypothetical protein